MYRPFFVTILEVDHKTKNDIRRQMSACVLDLFQ